DEVRIYNVARSPTQIQADMGLPIGTTVPIVSLSTSAIDFGQEAVGVTSVPSTVTLTNTGNAPLNIGSITISGSNSSEFGQTNTCGSSIAGGGSCSLSVTLTAATAGAKTANLLIQDDASGSPHGVSLTGTGVGVLVTPSSATLTPAQTQQFAATAS